MIIKIQKPTPELIDLIHKSGYTVPKANVNYLLSLEEITDDTLFSFCSNVIALSNTPANEYYDAIVSLMEYLYTGLHIEFRLYSDIKKNPLGCFKSGSTPIGRIIDSVFEEGKQ